ncbi:bestrophin-like domain [Undibacterium terreum]|uniref:DUF4239 domain-containing protein n=1 Tax=Undibacterium terreum TaxID=1224302 RepID=A0A916V173_9BURK|nr:DUF4239 domain-containing protein [Undibacterium terreum]GGD01475.1 hypothetical protein GCM10011396_56250 [Undibacterium terreum]
MEVLYAIDAWQLALALLFALLLVIEASYRIGRRSNPAEYERSSSVFSTLMGAALALLGLLLAFSFAMASARYDLRKGVILKEANAIGTVYLRTELLADNARGQTKKLLRQYVDARLEGYRAGIDGAKAKLAASQTEALQQQIWHIASTEMQQEKSISNSLFVTALNDMIDISSEQIEAGENHVPELVIWLLLISALLTGAMSGYACGAIGHRNLFATCSFALLVALVIFSILDLDRPQRGLIQVNKHPLQSLQQSLQQDARQNATR